MVVLYDRVGTRKTISCLFFFPASCATDDIELGLGNVVVVEYAVLDVVLLTGIHQRDVQD